MNLEDVNVQHTYEIIFTEEHVNVYTLDQFLNDFEKLCIKHNVKLDHINVKLIERK